MTPNNKPSEHVSEMRFDEDKARKKIKEDLDPYTNWNESWPYDQERGFVKGSRWQFNQNKAALEQERAKVKELENELLELKQKYDKLKYD